MPCTFQFDEERLKQIRNDMLDIISIEICLNLWKAIQASSRIARLKLFASKLQKKAALTSEEYTRASLLELVNGFGSNQKDKWQDASKPIALELFKSISSKTGPIALTTLESHLASHLSKFRVAIFQALRSRSALASPPGTQ